MPARPFLLFLSLLAATFTLAACDNPVDDTDDDHAEADGLVLTLDGAEIYRVLDGQASCAQPPCGIAVPQGQTTSLIAITFLDVDGDPLPASALDEDLALAIDIADPSIATSAVSPPWQFRIEGLRAGTTAMRIRLLHNGEHDDFTTPPLESPNAIQVKIIALRKAG